MEVYVGCILQNMYFELYFKIDKRLKRNWVVYMKRKKKGNNMGLVDGIWTTKMAFTPYPITKNYKFTGPSIGLEGSGGLFSHSASIYDSSI